MKKLIAFVLVASFIAPILISCGEKSESVDSNNPPTVIDSEQGGKKGPMENNKGINN